MRKIVFIISILLVFTIGCSAKKLITMDNLVKQKNQLDSTENPARKLLIEKQLLTRKIALKDVVVKDVVESTNIDYDFAVIVEREVGDKKLEFHVYTKNLAMVARLVKGKSRIDVSGNFRRFFTMLDEYFTKVDIVEARIFFSKKAEKEKNTEKK